MKTIYISGRAYEVTDISIEATSHALAKDDFSRLCDDYEDMDGRVTTDLMAVNCEACLAKIGMKPESKDDIIRRLKIEYETLKEKMRYLTELLGFSIETFTDLHNAAKWSLEND